MTKIITPSKAGAIIHKAHKKVKAEAEDMFLNNYKKLISDIKKGII